MTTVDTTETVAPATPEPEPQPVRPARRSLRAVIGAHRFGLLVSLGYVLGGFWVFAREWRDVTHRLVGDGQDHQLLVWAMANAARSVTHGESLLFSDRLNVPDGVNLMANTTVLGVGVPMTPITLLFGPFVTYALLAILSLAGTAAGWYYVFSRRLVSSKGAAAVGGALCGFAPGMIAHSPGHMHMIAQFVLPFIVLFSLKLADPKPRTVRDGIILGLLITYQVFIGEETLLLTAFGLAGVVGAYALVRPAQARRRVGQMLKGLGIAAALSGALLAYPLWFQFIGGPQRAHGLPFDTSIFVTDVMAYVTFPRLSLGGDAVGAARYSTNSGEQNAFFGWPLMLLTVAIAGWLWRMVAVKVLVITGLVFVALSLGKSVVIAGHDTGIPGPFRLLTVLPLLDLALATRFTLIVVPVIGALLALAGDRISQLPKGPLPTRLLLAGTMAAALVPLIPVPVPSFNPPRTPEFITSGAWRAYVPEGRTLVPVPLPRSKSMDGMRWSAVSNVEFAIPRGYFIGPDRSTPPKGVFNPPARPTSDLLRRVAETGKVPVVTEADRQAAREDLRYWRGGVVVLAPQRHAAALYSTLVALLGQGVWTGGCWIWDVRTLTA